MDRFLRRCAAPLLALLLAAAPAHADSAEDRAVRWNEEGVRLTEAGRLQDAVRAFERALEDAPRDEVVLRNLALARSALGARLLAEGDLVGAEVATRRALDAAPDDPVIRLNLGTCLEERGFPARAAVEVRQAAALSPDLGAARARLGDVLHREGNLEGAVREWEAAERRGVRDEALRSRLERARASLAVERRLRRSTSARFEVRHDAERHGILASRVLRELEEAQDVASAELGLAPPERLVVVLLSPQEFRTVTGAADWAMGLYDGRIRVCVTSRDQADPEVLARVRHEHAHALLAPFGKRVPGWLHEGLAQVREGRSVAQARRRLEESGRLPYASVVQHFSGTPDEGAARLQYDTALAFVAWLREGERGPRLRAALRRLAEDDPLDAAFRTTFGALPEELYARFLETL